jgi:hypothetical protein
VTWAKLAGELEGAQRFLDALNGAKLDGPEMGSLLLPGADADSSQL